LPVLFKETAPAKLLLLCVKPMVFAPAFKVAVPPTVKAPTWLMPAPLAVAIAVKSVPMLEAAKTKDCVLVRVAVVPLVKATLPMKLLLLPLVVKSMEVPAFKVVVPGTTIVPLWLMAAPAVKDRFPPLFKVTAGSTIFAATLLKFRVKLRSAVSDVKLVGAEAAALALLKLKSCTLLKVAPEAKLIAPLMLFAWSRIILEPAVFSARVNVPMADAA